MNLSIMPTMCALPELSGCQIILQNTHTTLSAKSTSSKGKGERRWHLRKNRTISFPWFVVQPAFILPDPVESIPPHLFHQIDTNVALRVGCIWIESKLTRSIPEALFRLEREKNLLGSYLQCTMSQGSQPMPRQPRSCRPPVAVEVVWESSSC